MPTMNPYTSVRGGRTVRQPDPVEEIKMPSEDEQARLARERENQARSILSGITDDNQR